MAEVAIVFGFVVAQQMLQAADGAYHCINGADVSHICRQGDWRWGGDLPDSALCAGHRQVGNFRA